MIHLTPAAVTAVRRFIDGAATPVSGLRLMISGGGCAGLQYGMRLECAKADDDWEIEVDGLKLFIDPMTWPLLDNARIDFIDGLAHTGFRFDNPNVAARCSCGQSFAG